MFYAYAILLVVSGIATLVVAAAISAQGTGSRVITGLFGAGYLGYGLYLLLLRPHGGYFVFFYAIILPVLLIIRAVRAGSAKAREQRILAATPKPIPYPYAYPPQYLPNEQGATIVPFGRPGVPHANHSDVR
jgi:hypothetical protein